MLRSQSRNTVSSSNRKSCSASRSTSGKKYIKVVSKGDSYESNHTLKNMAGSAVSLPVSYGVPHSRANSQHHRQTMRSMPHVVQTIVRSTSRSHIENRPTLSSQRIIVRETVRAVPVNFMYFDKKQIQLNAHSNQLHEPHLSLSKQEILMSQPSPQYTNIVTTPYEQGHRLEPKYRHSISYNPKFTPPPFAQRISLFDIPPRSSIPAPREEPMSSLGRPTISVELKNNVSESSKFMNNEKYLNFEIKLGDSHVEDTARSTNNPADTQNYNSLSITKGDTIKNMKENLEIGSCNCKKLNNFSNESEIKINMGQALRPKKNFVFV